MKKIFFLAAICVSAIVSAQSNKEDIDLIQAAYGKDKKAIVAEFIQLEGAKKDAFWKLYDQYETERKTLGKKRPAERRAEERVAMMPLFVRAIQVPEFCRETRNELNGEAE